MRKFFLAMFGALLACNLLCWTIGSVELGHQGASPIWRWTFGIFFTLQLVGLALLVMGRLVGRQPGTGMTKPYLTLVMIWNLLLLIPTTALNLLAFGIPWFLGTVAHLSRPMPSPWVSFLVFLGPGLALLSTGVALWQLGRFRVQRAELHFADLPTGLDGLKIAHLSDLHVGLLTNGPVLEKIVAAANDLQPDLIAVTGDLINMSLTDLPTVIQVLRGLQARYGVLVCEGNHDLIENAEAFREGLRQTGIRLLEDELVTLAVGNDLLSVLGVRYAWTSSHGSRDPIEELKQRCPPGSFSLLLAHHPDRFDAAAEAGISLTLAGHTHGGQIMINRRTGFGPRLFKYWSGHYQRGCSQLIVSNGTGNWFPLRIQAPAEIILLTLRQASPALP